MPVGLGVMLGSGVKELLAGDEDGEKDGDGEADGDADGVAVGSLNGRARRVMAFTSWSAPVPPPVSVLDASPCPTR